MDELDVERWVLAGTDYVYPRTTNKILESYLKAKGVDEEDIMISYTRLATLTGSRLFPISRSLALQVRKQR